MERKLLVIAILIFLTTSRFSQKGIVKGKITDKLTGEEIVGAAVLIEGTTIGTATNFTGDFNMNVEPGTYNFRCQFISYEPLVMQSVTIQSGVETVINFNLVSAELKLDEVKVVARANRESEAMLLMDQKISLIEQA
jgi:hypothetical protein